MALCVARMAGLSVTTVAVMTIVSATLASAQQSSTLALESTQKSADSLADARAVQPERPTIATHAYTVAPGYVEIETGAQEMRPNSTSQFIAPIVVKFGIIPRLQLELQSGYVYNRTAGASNSVDAGATDIAIALKQRVLEAAPIIQDLSVQWSVKFATGAHDIGTGTTDLSVLLISSREIGATELDLNAGYTHRSGNGTTVPISATLLTASLGGTIWGALGGVAELFSYPGTGGLAGTHPEIGFLTGPTVQLRPWFVLDAGVIFNVRNIGANAVYAGVTYNVGRIPGVPAPRN